MTADGTTYTINQTYQATTGYRATLEYPVSTSGYRLKLAYDYQNGILQRIRDANGSTHFWTLTSTNPFGQPQNETYGSGVAAYTEYDPASGWMLRRQAGVGGGTGLVDAVLTWDTAGNLLSRQDLKQSVTETFVYDTLNRLTTSQRNGVQNLGVTFNAIGNILTKSDVGSYSYHATKKRAVTQAGSTSYGYDANGNMTSRGGSSISYTSYNLPSVINAGSETSALSYGAFRNRFKQVTAGASPETRIYVAGLLEKVTRAGVTEYRYQIGGPTGTVAIYTRRTDGSTPTYYLLQDHLGSPEMITNTAGVPTVKLSSSAYGERRGSNWSGTPTSGEWNAIAFTTRDGFTEHEHLDNVGLVHMNGRVYDPKIGRFLSSDPFIDWGLGTQGVNRYGYVGNNPLNRTDPTGFSNSATRLPKHDSGEYGPLLEAQAYTLGTEGDPERLTALLGQVSIFASRQISIGFRFFGFSSAGATGGNGDWYYQARGGPSGGTAPSGVAGRCDNPGPDEAVPVIVASPARTQCLEDCRRSLEPAVQGAAGAAGGFAGGFVAGAPMPGLGQLSAATIGAFAGGMTGFVTGVMAQSSASQPTRISLGLAAGAVTGGNVFLLQGGVGGARAVATMGLAGMLGAAAPASAGGVAGAAATATALSSVAAGVVAAVGAGTWFGYRMADAMADGICGLKCGD